MKDTKPIWSIVIWEDIEETSKLESLKFKGEYRDAVDYAKAKLNHYKTNPESHFTIEQEKQMLSFTDLIEDYYDYTEEY